MSVTNVALAWAGSTGSETKQGREFTTTYRVETDTHLDQTKTIIDFFRDNASFGGLALPYLDSRYAFANDSDTSALCDSIAPKRAENSQQHWTVEFHYKTPDEEEEETGETESGDASNNPLDWRPTVDISFVEYTRPVTRAIYRGGYTNHNVAPGDLWWFNVGDDAVVVNSAGDTLDPPLERAALQQLFRFGKYWFEYPWVSKFAFTAVNSRPFEVLVRDPNMIGKDGKPTDDQAALMTSFNSYQCQITTLSGALVRKNGATVWKLSTEMLVDREFGFRVEVLDRGLHASAGDGDPDGMGGFYSPGDEVEGRPDKRRLLDVNGIPLSEPVLLNGAGQPLMVGQLPVYSTWSIYPEHDFKAFTDILPIKVD
jgi:hypothetical protein